MFELFDCDVEKLELTISLIKDSVYFSGPRFKLFDVFSAALGCVGTSPGKIGRPPFPLYIKVETQCIDRLFYRIGIHLDIKFS